MPKRKAGYKNGVVPYKRPYRAPKPSYKSSANFRTGGFNGLELKFIDYTYSGAIVGTSASAEANPSGIGCLNATATGDTESSRDGRRNIVKSVHVKGCVILDNTNDASSLPAARVVRVVMYHDTQSNGVEANSEDIMLSTTNVEEAFRNLQFSKRFRILHDQTFDMAPISAAAGTATTVDTGGVVQSFKINKKMNMPVNHDGSTAVVGSITDNAIGMIAFASNSGCTLNYTSRVRFLG